MTASGFIRVVLIDDHRHIHQAVATILDTVADIHLVAHGSSGEEALILCREHQPQVLLLDVLMPVMDGIDTARLIHERFPDIKILTLSGFDDDDSVRQMLQQGAVGYILKTSLMHDLIHAIRAAVTGTGVFSSGVTRALLRPASAPVPTMDTFGLTARELEVLRLIAGGQSNTEIAARLVISQSTVKFHTANILQKMGVETRAEAIVRAAKNDLL